MKRAARRAINAALGSIGYRLVRPDAVRPPDPPPEPAEIEPHEREAIAAAGTFSMTGRESRWALCQSIRHVHKARIPGDFVECGVWRGGNLILMKRLLSHYGCDRAIYGFDTFDGMSEPTELDRDYTGAAARQLLDRSERSAETGNVWAYCDLDSVRANIAQHASLDRVHLIKGKVEETLNDEANLPRRIAILRLDTDWYESTRAELETLYPRLSSGGVLIVDDYGHWQGARRAVDEYFGADAPWLHYVDYTCRLMVKP